MKTNFMTAPKVLVTILSVITPAAAQPWIQPVDSPVGHPDRTVTFHYKAPGARKVEVSGQFISGNQAMTPEVFDKYFGKLAENPEETNQRLKLLWLGVGTDDFLYKSATTFESMLKEKHIRHESLVTDGGHTWMNARHYLAETLQLFFK